MKIQFWINFREPSWPTLDKHTNPKSCLWKCRFLGSHSVHLNFFGSNFHTPWQACIEIGARNKSQKVSSRSINSSFNSQVIKITDTALYLPHNLPAFGVHPEVDRWSMYFSLENWGVPASHLTLSFRKKRRAAPKEDITRKRDFLPTFFGEHFCYT